MEASLRDGLMEASLREPPWSLHGHKKHSCSMMEALMDAGLCGIHAQIITQYSFLIPRFGSADGVSEEFRFSLKVCAERKARTEAFFLL